MHTYLYRLNTLFTIASTTLAVICVATSLTDWTIRPDPKVKLAVQSYDGLQKEYRNDRAWLTVDVEADLRSVFHWNTKQAFVYITADFKTAQNAVNEVMIWSRIVQEKGNANVRELVRLEYPYALTDPSYSMRNLTCDLHLDWETVPVVGVLHRSRRSFGEFVFPGDYFRTKAVPRNSNSGW
ncbi:g10537 [Coccomyxa viridis]|uniref:Signal peptidase complex subunit 3 n=1 Tax=Coccomyxa viridis TaxID=1274662 RepID=A0ABP1G9U6_9CHLO